VFFDAHLDARALGRRDLEDLRFFGVTGALVPVSDWPSPTGADAIRRDWTELSGPLVRRMKRCGVAGYVALGIHPARIPRSGLEALLTDLPDFLGRPSVVAIGEIGLVAGTPREEEVFGRQLALAKDLRIPVLVRTPWRATLLRTRRILAILRQAELEPSKVLVDHADTRTAKMIRACGYRAGICLSATPTSGRRSFLDEAVRLVESLGPEGLILGSGAGEGAGDLLALPRIADRMASARLSDAVIRRVCGGNAVAFFGVRARIAS
jgi:predicted metal-dependent TIM-barrel fold hydrolase